jgi:hypothetical protein
MFEFIFNGTGTSSESIDFGPDVRGLMRYLGSTPSIKCLTDPETTCRTCPSTRTLEGKKNIRRNTSAIIRKRIAVESTADDGLGEYPTTSMQDITVVVDVGKTFLWSALEWVNRMLIPTFS